MRHSAPRPAPRPAPRRRARRSGPPAWVMVPALGALFAFTLLAPIPTTGNHARSEVLERVTERLPGWQVVRAGPSWEGAWTVVAACGGREIGFQLVPGHGLGPRDAWLQPQNEYTRSRLARVSDDSFYLVWYERGYRVRSLSCLTELALRSAETRVPFDLSRGSRRSPAPRC